MDKTPAMHDNDQTQPAKIDNQRNSPVYDPSSDRLFLINSRSLRSTARFTGFLHSVAFLASRYVCDHAVDSEWVGGVFFELDGAMTVLIVVSTHVYLNDR